MRKALGIAVLLALAAAVAITAARFERTDGWRAAAVNEPAPRDRSDARLREAQDREEEDAAVETLCSTCHVQPSPDCQPKRLWPRKIELMYAFARGPRPVSPNRILPIDVPIRYYTTRAAEEFSVPEDAMGSPPSPLPFKRRPIALEAIPSPPAISCVKFVRLSDDGPQQLLICDMRHGLVVLWTPSRANEPARVIAHVPHPCRVQVVDLDGDGLRDILVANLGEFWPVDTDKGSVVWLRNRGNGRFDAVVLADKLSRVADLQAVDFDGDGDLDVVLAAFGQVNTGGIVYLENVTKDWSHPEFEPVVLDYRAGASDIHVVDLNQDGHPDFVALVSQEHEKVIAFLNRGWGSFAQETIYAAPHCAWASVGIRLIDLNGDGKMDVLLANGDQVEFGPVIRPYHGLAWLENKGTYPFAYHRITHMPGAHTLLPCDLDGDGKVDIVSSAFIPTFNPNWPGSERLDSVVWLRQTAPGQFKRYALETGTPFHPVGDVGDIDGDGHIDIVMGNFLMFPSKDDDSSKACLTVFENRLAPRAAK
jgi:hypothetical protein